MNDFIANARAVSISYSDTTREMNFTLLQRRAWDTFFKFVTNGAVYKKNSIKWFLCKYWLYSNSELKELYQKKYGKSITNNTLNVSRYNLCRSLEKLMGYDFFETFCEQDDEVVADNMAKKLIKHIKTLELHDEKYASLFIDALICVDTDITDKDYRIDELKGELAMLREYTHIILDAKLSNINKSKLAYIRRVLNDETIVNDEINTEKLSLLQALIWG